MQRETDRPIEGVGIDPAPDGTWSLKILRAGEVEVVACEDEIEARQVLTVRIAGMQ